jgi:hypothetical protein
MSDTPVPTNYKHGFDLAQKVADLETGNQSNLDQMQALLQEAQDLVAGIGTGGVTSNPVPPATASGGTIATTTTISRVAPSAAVSGVVLQPGTTDGQEVLVVNQSQTDQSITFGAPSTSHVANGSLTTIAGLTYVRFVWDAPTAAWYAPGGIVPPSTAGTPTNLTAVAGDALVTLTWTAAPNATSYDIQQATPDAAGPYATVGNVQGTTATVSALLNGHQYWFRVRALLGSVPGGTSTAATATPVTTQSIPVAPVLASVTAGDARITGVLNPVGNADSYQVFISTTATFTTPELTITATTGGQGSNYPFTLTTIGGAALTNGTPYNVMARAVNVVGASANSGVVQATPVSTTSYATQVLATAGLAGFWELSETTGTTAADQVGTPHNGTWDVAPTFSTPGHPRAGGRTGVTLNGSQHVTIADVAALDLADTLSLAAWVRRGATQGVDMAIVSKGAGSYYLRFTAANQLQLLRSQTAGIASSTASITDTNWHYVVATKAGATVHLYIDGADVTGTVTNSTMVDNANALNIGSDQGGERYVGDVMDVQVYNVALSAATVAAHYSGGGGAPPPPPTALAVTAKTGYAYVELTWSGGPSNAAMYRLSRRPSGGGAYTVIDTVPGTSYIDPGVTGGSAYDYVVAAKTPDPGGAGLYRLGPDSAATTITVSNTLPAEGAMATINGQIAGATAGSRIVLAAGIYRIPKDGLPSFNKNLTLASDARNVWFMCSRDWGNGREAANTWTPIGSYWRSSRTAPSFTVAAEDPNNISNATLSGFYNNVTVWNANGGSQWLTPMAAGSVPAGNQVCYESASDHRLRIGVNPASWQRIEVTESPSWGGATANDVIFEGLTFRGAGGGASDASFDIRGRQNIQFKNCVMGSTHAGGITMYQGETSTPCNMLIQDTWFDRCGYSPLSASSINGVTVRRCRFDSTGGVGYNEIWHGGDFKFVGGPTNILIEYCVSNNTTGASYWADITTNGYEIRYCKCSHNRNFYAFSHEISLNGNVHHNLFWDGGRASGYPTAHTDQGNTLSFHDNTVVGSDGTLSPSDGRVFQFQGAQADGTLRGDAPPGGVFGNSITNNFFVHLGHDAFTWSMRAEGGKFTFNGNRWWSAAPLWRFDNYNNNILDILTWNAIPDVVTDTFASATDKDRQLKFWGILTDDTSGGT